METAYEQERTFTGWVSALAREHTHALARVARGEGLVSADALDAVQEAFETFLRLPQARSIVGAPDCHHRRRWAPLSPESSAPRAQV
jgi:RNA polymerase sigma-70 factor (ECF subfamily)